MANLANTKWCKKPDKWLKPWHIGTHLRVIGESYPINTNMTGLRIAFQIFLHNCAWDKSSLSIGRVNPFMHVPAKSAWLLWLYLYNISNVLKIFEGEMFTRTLSTTLLQISGKFMLNSKDIFKKLFSCDKSRWWHKYISRHEWKPYLALFFIFFLRDNATTWLFSWYSYKEIISVNDMQSYKDKCE